MRGYLSFTWALFAIMEATGQGNPHLAESMYDKGVELQNSNNHIDAINQFNKCISISPGFVEAYSARAASREQTGDLTGALTDLNSCIELLPGQFEALLSRGSLLFRIGRYDDARNDFLQLLTLPAGETNTIFYRRSAHSEGTDRIMTAQGSSVRSQIFNYLGLIENQLANSKTAIRYLDSAIALNNSDADYFANRALAKQSIHDSTFVRDYRRALAINPNHAIAKNNLALQSASKGDYGDTEQQLTEAIASDSTLYFPYLERGYYRMKMGNLYGALDDYNQAIKINDSDPQIWLNRGLVKEKLNNHKGAFADYTKAIDLKEDLVEAWLNRGNVLLKQARYADAIEDYSAAITYQPDYGSAFYNRAIANHHLKKSKEACEDLLKAEKLGVEVTVKTKNAMCK